MLPMKKNWNYQHIIDLEYFFHRDIGGNSKKTHERDRTIFLDTQKDQDRPNQPRKTTRKNLIWAWLTTRTSKEFGVADKRSPGTIFTDTLLLAKNISTLKGVIVGLVAGLSFFTYTGTTPVNVFHFLLFFVVPQLVFVALLATACLLHLVRPRAAPPSFYSFFFRAMTTKAIATLHKQWLKTFSAEKRGSITHAFGIIKSRSNIYGSLFNWPVFILFQLFAIGFNLGLLATTLLKILASDLAFGWQSTLQLSAEGIYQAVKFIALPWSWFLPQSVSFPSLAEIEGSRIILKEGIYHLATQNLIAWWPFLAFCLLFYGLAFRFGLLIFGRVMEKKSLAQIQFDTPDCISLAQRMQTPLVSTQAAPEPDDIEIAQAVVPQKEPMQRQSNTLLPQVVLIPDDIFLTCSSLKLNPHLNNNGFSAQQLYAFMAGYDEDQQLIELLASRDWKIDEGLLIVMEAWMPPLVDFLSYLRSLRQVLPENTIINITLIGKPGDTIFTPAQPSNYTVWKNKITALGDPYLNLFQFAAESNNL